MYSPEKNGAFPKIKNLIVLEEPWYILYIALHEIEDAARTATLEHTRENNILSVVTLSFSLSFPLSVTRSPFGYIQLNRAGMLSHRPFECDPRVPRIPELECTSRWNETGEVLFPFRETGFVRAERRTLFNLRSNAINSLSLFTAHIKIINSWVSHGVPLKRFIVRDESRRA